jgi:hypothetical protein
MLLAMASKLSVGEHGDGPSRPRRDSLTRRRNVNYRRLPATWLFEGP